MTTNQIIPPIVTEPLSRIIFPEGMMKTVQRVADRHYEDDDGVELSTDIYPIAACRGPVAPHTDSKGSGKIIWGWVLRSDGHELVTRWMVDNEVAPQPLRAGCMYRLDPDDKHWTTCPTEDAQLIVVVAFFEMSDPRSTRPSKIANYLKWETMHSVMLLEKREAQDAEDEKTRYRGIAIGGDHGQRA